MSKFKNSLDKLNEEMIDSHKGVIYFGYSIQRVVKDFMHSPISAAVVLSSAPTADFSKMFSADIPRYVINYLEFIYRCKEINPLLKETQCVTALAEKVAKHYGGARKTLNFIQQNITLWM